MQELINGDINSIKIKKWTPFPENRNQPNLFYIKYKSTDAKGPTWARSRAEFISSKSDYWLLIDSHMRTTKYWDEKLIIEHNKNGHNTILSCYPTGFKRNILNGQDLSTVYGRFMMDKENLTNIDEVIYL